MAGYLETLSGYWQEIVGTTPANAETLAPPPQAAAKLPNCDTYIPSETRPVVVYELRPFDSIFGYNAQRDPKGDAECKSRKHTRTLTSPVAVHIQYAGFQTYNPAFTCVDESEILYADCAIYIAVDSE